MLDAPSWDTIQIAKTAARIYAPLGTGMRLGDWVRVVRAFIEGFGGASRVPRGRKWDNGSAEEPIVEEADEDQTDPEEYENAYRLAQELKVGSYLLT
jgi:glycerol-3-phosphate O-acyltransferase/dihydroxyacetone phosphate acyltransferase